MKGHLGNFTLSLHWMNLGNQPVEILIEDVFLLVVPSTETPYDPEDEEQRAQAAKLERLESAELLHLQTPDAGTCSLIDIRNWPNHLFSKHVGLCSVTRTHRNLDCQSREQSANNGQEHSYPIRGQAERSWGVQCLHLPPSEAHGSFSIHLPPASLSPGLQQSRSMNCGTLCL